MSRIALALLAASALTACATTEGRSDATAAGGGENVAASRTVDRQARQRIAREDMLTQMAFWAGEYQAFPNDLEAAQRFSDALRRGGRADRAAQVAGEALNRFPEDRQLLATFGLALVQANRPQEALRPLAVVAQAEPQNWRVRSALGAALDQLGRFDEARRAYQEALAIDPGNARVLTNLGVSQLLAGDPAAAETVLRQATAIPNAPAEARQNLAISLALQGRFDEAEQIERIDLPPAQAAENIQYLRNMLSDPRRWGDLRRPS